MHVKMFYKLKHCTVVSYYVLTQAELFSQLIFSCLYSCKALFITETINTLLQHVFVHIHFYQ